MVAFRGMPLLWVEPAQAPPSGTHCCNCTSWPRLNIASFALSSSRFVVFEVMCVHFYPAKSGPFRRCHRMQSGPAVGRKRKPSPNADKLACDDGRHDNRCVCVFQPSLTAPFSRSFLEPNRASPSIKRGEKAKLLSSFVDTRRNGNMDCRGRAEDDATDAQLVAGRNGRRSMGSGSSLPPPNSLKSLSLILNEHV